MLLNDKVPFRMQWPQFADLQVNGNVVNVFFEHCLIASVLGFFRSILGSKEKGEIEHA